MKRLIFIFCFIILCCVNIKSTEARSVTLSTRGTFDTGEQVIQNPLRNIDDHWFVSLRAIGDIIGYEIQVGFTAGQGSPIWAALTSPNGATVRVVEGSNIIQIDNQSMQMFDSQARPALARIINGSFFVPIQPLHDHPLIPLSIVQYSYGPPASVTVTNTPVVTNPTTNRSFIPSELYGRWIRHEGLAYDFIEFFADGSLGFFNYHEGLIRMSTLSPGVGLGNFRSHTGDFYANHNNSRSLVFWHLSNNILTLTDIETATQTRYMRQPTPPQPQQLIFIADNQSTININGQIINAPYRSIANGGVIPFMAVGHILGWEFSFDTTWEINTIIRHETLRNPINGNVIRITQGSDNAVANGQLVRMLNHGNPVPTTLIDGILWVDTRFINTHHFPMDVEWFPGPPQGVILRPY